MYVCYSYFLVDSHVLKLIQYLKGSNKNNNPYHSDLLKILGSVRKKRTIFLSSCAKRCRTETGADRDQIIEAECTPGSIDL